MDDQLNNEKVKILVVDDMETNRIILREILSDKYRIEEAADGLEALSLLFHSIEKPHLVLLDIMMPGMDGLELLNIMKEHEELKNIPIIFISASGKELEGLQAGAIDYILKPFEPDIVKMRVANHLELNLYREKLESLVKEKAGELVATKETFLETMAGMIEYRSLESGEHIYRTKKLTEIMVMQIIIGSEYRQQLLKTNYSAMIKASALHDVGKIGIPDNILLKPGKLTPEEFKVIETHTIIGADMIKSMMLINDEDEYFKHSYDIARSHHERWDGNGYPDKLKGEDIPLSARIVSIVDVYDALVSERCYKKAFSHEQAVDIITKDAGTHFDPELVRVFLEIQDRFR